MSQFMNGNGDKDGNYPSQSLWLDCLLKSQREWRSTKIADEPVLEIQQLRNEGQNGWEEEVEIET